MNAKEAAARQAALKEIAIALGRADAEAIQGKSEKLKPCPFCGGNAKLEMRETKTTHIQYWNYRILCLDCLISTEWYALNEGKSRAIDIWNRRASGE